MIVKYVLIMIIVGGGNHKTSFAYEFNNLKQCQYVYETMQTQVRAGGYGDHVLAGGCFEK